MECQNLKETVIDNTSCGGNGIQKDIFFVHMKHDIFKRNGRQGEMPCWTGRKLLRKPLNKRTKQITDWTNYYLAYFFKFYNGKTL